MASNLHFPRSGGSRLIALAAVALVLTAHHRVLADNGRTRASQGAQQPPRTAMRDAVSDQELRKKFEVASGMDAQMQSKTKPLTEVRPSAKSSILTSSVVLFDGEMFTVVPIGSVLNLPPAHRRKVVEKPEGVFTYWPSFLQRNESWLTVKEVPLKMAKGDRELAKGILRQVSKDHRVVISVYKGGPITILEPLPEEKGAKETASATPQEGGAKPQRKN